MTDYWMQAGGSYSNDFIRSLDAQFGKNARARREFLQYSQEIVAILLSTEYAIKWHQTVVAKVESGERKVKLSEAYALADIYGMPLEELTHGENLDHVWLIKRENQDGRKVAVAKRGPRIAGPLSDSQRDERERAMKNHANLTAEVVAAQKKDDNGEYQEAP